jgi:hypothetical protein
MTKWLVTALALLLLALGVTRLRAAPSEASESLDGITVTGPEDFRQRTREALDALDVTWHSFVVQWLNTVEYDAGLTRRDGNSYVNIYSATFHVSRRTAFAYDKEGYARDSIAWYACGLVHEAQHVYQYKHSKLKYGREAEFDAIGVQLECLRKLGAPRYIQEYTDGLRECIHADGCKYWKQHRGW